MARAAFVVAGWCALWAVSAVSAAPVLGPQDMEARRGALLAGVAKWKLMVPEGPNDPVRRTFLPQFERIETEARKPEAALDELDKQFTMWKNLLLSELQATGGYKNQEAFLELSQERMKALVTVQRLEASEGAAGRERVSFWKSRINDVRDATSLRRLYDNMRALEGASLVRSGSSAARFPHYVAQDAVFNATSSRVRPEQAEAPPTPGFMSMAQDKLQAIKDYLISRGARPGIVGQTIELVVNEVKRYSVDPALVLAVILKESGYNPRAESPVGAKGLMQIMPATGRGLGLREYELFDPIKNVKAGIRFLNAMIARFNGDIKMALAAYNAGPGAVDKYNGIPPYKETRGYVRKVYDTYLALTSLIFQS
ncbi:MAG: lytic transglycosylase domain-containing protein [Elusimicrobia bacterium]|nr:lytic transglycosylase domain-containing protein [Elusimicrobiota bacterium]